MSAVVGGMFGFENPLCEGEAPPWSGHEIHTLFTANARGAIRWLVDHISAQKVWVPAYLCHTMIDWIQGRDDRVEFYPVNHKLNAISEGWLEDIRPGDLVIVVAWFGRRVDYEFIKQLRDLGAVVLEDASQAWFTENLGQQADWLLFSPRKFVGVPDGGVLISLTGECLSDVELPASPISWWNKLLSASLERRIFDAAGGDERQKLWFELMRSADESAPRETTAMSELSRRMLESGIPNTRYSGRRVNNHNFLENKLQEISLFGPLADGEVPLGFVVMFPSRVIRDAVREKLIMNKIYPIIHWPIRGVVPSSYAVSHTINDRILTLVCDQRYGCVEMGRTVRIVREAIENAA